MNLDINVRRHPKTSGILADFFAPVARWFLPQALDNSNLAKDRLHLIDQAINFVISAHGDS